MTPLLPLLAGLLPETGSIAPQQGSLVPETIDFQALLQNLIAPTCDGKSAVTWTAPPPFQEGKPDSENNALALPTRRTAVSHSDAARASVSRSDAAKEGPGLPLPLLMESPRADPGRPFGATAVTQSPANTVAIFEPADDPEPRDHPHRDAPAAPERLEYPAPNVLAPNASTPVSVRPIPDPPGTSALILRVIESTAPAAPDFQLRTIHIETEPLPSPNLNFDKAVEGDVPSDIRLPAATRPTDPRPVNGPTPTPLIDRSAGENGNGRELPQPLPRLEGFEHSAASMPTARSPVESAAFSSSAGGPSVEVLVGFRRPQTPATEVQPDAKEVPAAKPPVFHTVQPASAASEPEFALEAAPHLEGCVAEASAASQEPEAFEEAPQSKTSGGEPLETRIAAPAASVVSKAPPAPAEAPAAIRPEVPELPRPHIARRVSLELGGEKTELRITVHERSGDVSVRFETGAPALRSDLQSNVGSLIEALRREHISLANLDFSGLNTAAQDTSRDHRQPRWRRPSTTPRPFVETGESTGGDRVTLSADRLGR